MLSEGFSAEGMKAYVNTIQRPQEVQQNAVWKHQKWSGAPYMDGILSAIQRGGSATKSMTGSTEEGEQLWNCQQRKSAYVLFRIRYPRE